MWPDDKAFSSSLSDMIEGVVGGGEGVHDEIAARRQSWMNQQLDELPAASCHQSAELGSCSNVTVRRNEN